MLHKLSVDLLFGYVADQVQVYMLLWAGSFLQLFMHVFVDWRE